MTGEADERIAAMRIYGETARRLIGDRTLEDFLSDEALRFALQYVLLVIGEASIHVPVASKAAMPDVPWQHLKGLRNRLAHGYFAIDPVMVYFTARSSIPDLLDVLDRSRDAASES